jgi:hypothetical protein
MVGHTTIIALGLKMRSKSTRRPFLDILDICNLLDPGPDFVQDDPPIGALQFTVDEGVLLELDVIKSAGPDGITPLILKNCAFAFARPFSFLFNRSLSTCIFPDRWKPIFKKGRRNNVEDYREVMAILSAILKRFELLVYRTI